MDDGLGALGFWLFVGMVVAASIVSDGLKVRDKEREKQATLRAMLEMKGDKVAEVIAYIREKEAAEAAAAALAAASERETTKRLSAIAKAVLVFGGCIAVGIFAGGALRESVFRGPQFPVVPLATMLSIWMVGLVLAWRMWPRKQNDVHQDA